MDESAVSGNIEARLEKVEKEMQGLRKFVTTLETGHEARANAWNKRLALLTKQIEELTDRLRKTKKKVKKLRH